MRFYSRTQTVEATNLEAAKKKFVKLLGDNDFMIYDENKNLIAERNSYLKKKWRDITTSEVRMYREDLRTCK